MRYGAAVDYLYGLQKHGIKLGLEKMAALLSVCGSPHRGLKFVHIAGTNGKGSVSAMTASIIMQHGLKTGLFSSPHLTRFTERIKIDDIEIKEDEVAGITSELAGLFSRAGDDMQPTFFEFITAMAFVHFARAGADAVVLETGMGGRLDATNIVVPKVSVITGVSIDHTLYLGSTLKDIAREKAGIIKHGVPVVSASQDREVADILAARATESAAGFYMYGKDFRAVNRSSDLTRNIIDYEDCSMGIRMKDLVVPLAGEHQTENAALAIKAATVALGSMKVECRDYTETIRKGMSGVRLRGRLDLVNERPTVIIDGAHNAGAAVALARFLEARLAGRRLIFVLGIMSDKDIDAIVAALVTVGKEVICTAPASSRAEAPALLAEKAKTAGFGRVEVAATVAEGIAAAIASCKGADTAIEPCIVVTGSFYTAGEALQVFGERASLISLREGL